MPKQTNPPRLKAKQPARKRPKPPSTPYFTHIIPMVSPEIMQPSTNSRPPFNRQAGEQPNLDPAREVFRRSHGKIMAARGPQTQTHARNTVAAFTEKTLFEKLLTEHQDEIQRLRQELADEKEKNAALKAKLMAPPCLPSNKRKRLGGRLSDFED
jgi:hypothetical protein